MEKCYLCPRSCGADREKTMGRCRADRTIRLARAALHFWEEPCISGENGSGTVFFSGCSLGCVYCQNKPIASGAVGRAVTPERLSEIFFELKGKGAENINLVTADHYLPIILPLIRAAKENGIGIPFILNTASYLKEETVRKTRGAIDIYLADLKYDSPKTAAAYSAAADYPRAAKKAIDEMVRAAGEVKTDARGMMKSGVIVRHLVLPGHIEEAKNVIRYLHETYGDRIYMSIMNQYTPMEELSAYPELCRRVTAREYDAVLDYAIGIGVENAFIQEGVTAEESFIPCFDYEGV